MKTWKKFRQKLAAILVVVMAAGTMTVPTWADEVKKGWYCDENGDWYYVKSDGSLRKNKIWVGPAGSRDEGKWFAVDETGRMYCDELFISPDPDFKEVLETFDENEEVANLYALPYGNLAVDWIKLGEDYTLFSDHGTDDSVIRWYYFDDAAYPANSGMGGMVRGKEKKIHKSVYAFGRDGQMYLHEWGIINDEGMVVDEADLADDLTASMYRYYQAEGNKAVSRWLPIDGYWYHFDKDGIVDVVASTASTSDADTDEKLGMEVASTSNAECINQEKEKPYLYMVDSIEIVDGYDEVTTVVGEPVELKFKVNMASDSNARGKFNEKFHDIWGSPSKSGSAFKITNIENDILTVKYTPKLIREEEISLYIDDVKSVPILVIPKLATSEQQKTAVTTVMNSWKDEVFRPSQAREDIQNVVLEADDSQPLKDSLVKNRNYGELASAYAMEMGISESVNVDAEAEELLGDDSISVVGGALNAENTGSADLNVAAADGSELSQPFTNKVAFDISLEINGSEEPELDFPVKITMPVPEGFDANTMELYHIHNGVEEKVNFTVSGDTITFTTDKFSTFVFGQNGSAGTNTNTGSSSGDSSDSSSDGGSGSSVGVVRTDAKKGQVNSVTGIITGSGDGYSSWQSSLADDGSTKWQLRYADGTLAAGSIVEKEDGTTYEQPAWELINGAWYAFGADGNAKNGFVYDTALGGFFYVDINTGMKIGWLVIDGKWYYFSPYVNGKTGIMLVDAWIDGWYVDKNGIWDGQEQVLR